MNDVERMLAEHACQRLVYSYANFIDAYDYKNFMTLWAEDAEWDLFGTISRGTQAIKETLEHRVPAQLLRHLVTNVVVDITSLNTAIGSCYTVAFRGEGPRNTLPALITQPRWLVDYRDTFVKHPERGWLFSRREVISIMEAKKPT